MSIDRSNVRGLVRAIAYDVKGSRLGRVAQVFLDDRSDEPAWVAVDVTRVRGMRLLPLAGAAMKGRHLVIRAERTTVRSAPRIDLSDGQLSSHDESRLLEHYGLISDRPGAPTTEQRPASPWPDDTERETAWERPGPWQSAPQDTPTASPAAPAVAPAFASGWEQPTSRPGGIGDRAAMRTRDASSPQSAAEPPRQSDTAPTSIVDAPAPQSRPTPASDPRTGAETTTAIPVQGTASAAVPEPRPDGEPAAR
ncbi:MAG: hypothetical protein M3400_05395 [Actinomycetota bacterium]|nr:hypothetical protein [Actinomycetota bacterium]